MNHTLCYIIIGVLLVILFCKSRKEGFLANQADKEDCVVNCFYEHTETGSLEGFRNCFKQCGV